ncbi:hypothetical protein MRB53_015473 [Persea americana]|uniref:Uncharacterized protein n=1 Tax=Persea americana TaxID=3435 RepID=A0ACC2LZK2_PERAE|nr:hypothetical protein MRB53_015473 [Persea americana]
MKEEGKEASSAKKQRLAEAKSPGSISASKALMAVEATPIAKLFPPTPSVLPHPSLDRENAERSIALFFFENKLDFSVARSSSYQLMMDAVAKCGQGFRGPSSETLKNTWLQRIKSEVTQQSRDIEKERATTVEEIAAVSEPLLKLLSDVAGGKPAVGSIYDSMTRVKESIRTYYIMDENKCKAFLDIVDRRWHNQLHSPLHSAAAFLNPCIQYNQDIKYLGIIKEEFLNVLEKLLPTPELRQDITGQIVAFKKAQGMFGCNLARDSRNTTAPGLWWEQYGDSAPGLQRLAARAKVKSADIDAIMVDDIDMTSDWVEESDQWLDRFGALESGDLNTRQFSNSIFGPNDHIFGL